MRLLDRVPNAVPAWCSGHSVGLLMKVTDDVSGIKGLIDATKEAVTFARTHSKPSALIHKESPNVSIVKWATTRFGTIFMVMQRLANMRPALRRVVLSDEWAKYLQSITDKAIRAKAQAFEALVLDKTYWAKILKVLELVEPWYVKERQCF